MLVGRVRFTGNRVVKSAELRRLMATRPASDKSVGLLSRATLSDDLRRIRSHYFDRGYVDARVGTPRIELAGTGAT